MKICKFHNTTRFLVNKIDGTKKIAIEIGGFLCITYKGKNEGHKYFAKRIEFDLTMSCI